MHVNIMWCAFVILSYNENWYGENLGRHTLTTWILIGCCNETESLVYLDFQKSGTFRTSMASGWNRYRITYEETSPVVEVLQLYVAFYPIVSVFSVLYFEHFPFLLAWRDSQLYKMTTDCHTTNKSLSLKMQIQVHGSKNSLINLKKPIWWSTKKTLNLTYLFSFLTHINLRVSIRL